MLKSKLLRLAGAMLAIQLATAGIGHTAELGAKDEPIKLAMLEWTGAHVTTHVAGQLLEKLGYKVEYVNAGNFPQFSGLADGTLSASVEVWLNNVGDIYPKVLAEKKIENIGLLELETREGWIYPKYMEQICPGLPGLDGPQQARMRKGALHSRNRSQWSLSRLSCRLGFARRNDNFR